MKKTIFFILIFFFNQQTYLAAGPIMEIPDEIVDDWDEALIEEQRIEEQKFNQERAEQDRQSRQDKSLQQNNDYQLKPNKPIKIKNTYTLKQLRIQQQENVQKYTQDNKLKPYKSPLQKPVLYQKIYIKDKHK